MLRSFFIFYFITCCNISNSKAQTNEYVYADSTLLEETTESQTNYGRVDDETDTILYKHIISIPADTIQAWKNEKKYAYLKNLDSLLKLKEQEELDAYQSGGSAPSFLQAILNSGFIQVFFGMIAIAVVGFILYKLFLNKGFFRKNVSFIPVKEIPEEDLINDPSDYDALIRQSYKLSDFRMAVRYLFLKTLRQLTDKGLLNRSVDKTNFQYVQEIAGDKKRDFASLVLNYEYVWYGNLQITREQYEEVEKRYTLFYNKI